MRLLQRVSRAVKTSARVCGEQDVLRSILLTSGFRYLAYCIIVFNGLFRSVPDQMAEKFGSLSCFHPDTIDVILVVLEQELVVLWDRYSR